MNPINAARAARYCINQNTPKYTQAAYLILSDLQNHGDWPARSEDCLRSQRCHCGYCTTHRTVMRELRGSIENVSMQLRRHVQWDLAGYAHRRGDRHSFSSDIQNIIDGET